MRKIISTIIMIGWPIFMFVVSSFYAPKYFEPMFKEPLGIALIVGSLVWLAVGAVLLLITSGARRAIVFALFPVPVTLVAMIGPAVLTIQSALKPVI